MFTETQIKIHSQTHDEDHIIQVTEIAHLNIEKVSKAILQNILTVSSSTVSHAKVSITKRISFYK